jgi:biotin synthase-like enzyme
MTTFVPRWALAAAREIYELPFATLLYQAHCWHLHHFDPNIVETCQLLNIKTAGCPEDCGSCSRSARHDTGVQATKLMELSEVIADARRARATAERTATRVFHGNLRQTSLPIDTNTVNIAAHTHSQCGRLPHWGRFGSR